MFKSLREVARELGVNRYWLKGFCEGRRIPHMRVGRMLALSPDAVRRVEQHLAKQPKAEVA